MAALRSMKPLLITAVACWAAVIPATIARAADELRAGFETPPDAAKPRVWWHWMNGNVSEEGIRLDLEWMKRVGVGGMQNFDAALDTPQVVDERLVYMTPPWKSAFRFAAGLADKLGLEMAIAASPGWSESGGPWVPPAQGMKKFVWSEMEVPGGKPVRATLPHPPEVTGPFQDLAMAADPLSNGQHKTPPQFYADAAVVAYRLPAAAPVPTPARVVSSSGPVDGARLTDGRLQTGVDIEAGTSPAWLRLDFDTPQTISAATLGMPPSGTIFTPPRWAPVLEASDDGRVFRRVAEFPQGIIPQYTISFAPVTARQFRISFVPKGPAGPSFDAAPGAMRIPLLALEPEGSAQRIHIEELSFHTTARVHLFEEKAGFVVARDYYAIQTPADARVQAVPAAEVIDLTSRMHADGTLDWTPPPGRWKILRFGYSLTGKENHPATAEATGLEVDKLDRTAVESYINTYLDTYRDVVGPNLIGARGVRAVLNDSIEVGAQNWTGNMLAEFRARRGYDPLPWLPALSGVIIESAAKSDAFLYDFRRTLADLLAENHYAQIARSAHARGLIHYSEALEAGRPTLGDDMDMRRHADIPMAAMWTFPPGEAPRATHYADMRGAASVAHIYGQNLAAAESLTAGYSPWAFSPRDLQPLIDMEFVSGINRPVIHTSVHQPVTEKKPGLSLAIFGQYFNRNETWAEQAGPWVSYISRSAYLLQQGRFVADVAYFYGEDAPLTALFRDEYPQDVPISSGFDFASADVVLNRLSVEDGDLITASGMRYRVLYLGGSSNHMTLAVLRRLRELVDAGATVVGERPIDSPSLADDPNEFRRIADGLWPSGTAADAAVSRGKGRVVRTRDVAAALTSIGIRPDFSYTKPEADSELLFLHRRIDDGDIYFVTNRRARAQQVTARFRVTGKRPELWHAQSGTSEPLSYRIEDGATTVPLNFAPSEGVFIVFRETADKPSTVVTPPTMTSLGKLDDGWQVRFEQGRGVAPDATLNTLGAWNESRDTTIRYFSGTGTYVRTLEVQPRWLNQYDALWLDLGIVREVAEVVVNGKSVGVLWREPYRVDIRNALKPGRNQIEVRVTNLWVNRLIGDAQPGAHKITFTTLPTYQPDAPLRLSGLIGPVSVSGQRPVALRR